MKKTFLIICIVLPMLLSAQMKPDKDVNGIKTTTGLRSHIASGDANQYFPPDEHAVWYIERDSLLSELSSNRYNNTNDTNKALLFWSLSKLYVDVNHDSSNAYAKKGLILSEQIGYKFGMGLCLEMLGKYNSHYSFNSSLAYSFRALKAYEDADRKWHIANILGEIAGVYYNMEQFQIALGYFEREKAVFETIADSNGLATTYHSIAGTYQSMGQSQNALPYELFALNYFEKNGNNHQLRSVYLNLGLNYAGVKQYSKAVYYSARSVRMAEAFQSRAYVLPEALKERGYIHFLIAIDSTTVLHPDSLLQTNRKANLELAIHYYRQSYALYKQSNIVHIEILERLYTALSRAGNYKEALWFYQQYGAVRDSQYSVKKQLQAAAQAVKREEELKIKQIEINNIQAIRKRDEQIFYIIGISLLSVIIILILRNYNRNLRTNELLERTNKELEEKKIKSENLALSLQESLIQKDELAAQLEKSAAMKSKFLANISHELRTPVTLLTGMLELMRDKNVSEKEAIVDKRKLNVAYNNSRKLQYMVEEILDLSKLENNQLKLNIKAAEIAPMVKRMVYAFETFIQKEQLNLIFSDTSCTGLFAAIDEDRFEKIINNLIYNAIKFNTRGGTIKVILQPLVENNSALISINNTGAGISAEDLPHIFERFYQGDTSKAKAEGAGIGLSLVKEFTLLMGGTVDVVSTVESGTTFTLEFPMVEKGDIEEAIPDIAPENIEVWDHFPERPTVLLVEDNIEMRYYLKEVLNGKVNLAEAGNGKEALKWLETNKPNLIISDIMMPEMDGQEFVTILKSNERYKKIPVITLTALADKDSRIGMLQMGVDDYIVKPFNAAELRIRAYNLLNNYTERLLFIQQPAEPDDIQAESKEAEELRKKITDFVLARLKNVTISVFDIAYELALSERQLYRLCKSLTGYTPAQLIKEVRLQKAYELLQSGDICKVEDVSRRVGFETTAYFSRQFFERFGKKPTEFL